jgi:hypothetical protein
MPLPTLPELPALPELPTLPAPLDRLLRRARTTWTATGRHEPGGPMLAVARRLAELPDDTPPGRVATLAREWLAASAAHRRQHGGAA